MGSEEQFKPSLNGYNIPEEAIEGPEYKPEMPEFEREEQEWQEMRKEVLGVDEKLIDEDFKEQLKLDEETREETLRYLEQENREITLKFATEWLEENKEKVLSETGQKEIKGSALILGTAKNLGAFEELNTKEEYADIKKELDNIDILRMDFKQEVVPLSSRSLALNQLVKILEKADRKYQEAKKSGDETLAGILEDKYRKLEELSRKFAEQLSGRDLKKEAEEQFQQPETLNENEYRKKAEANVDQYIEEEELRLKFNEENHPREKALEKLAREKLGLETEKRGWWIFGKKWKIEDKQSGLAEIIKRRKDVNEYLRNKLIDKEIENIKETERAKSEELNRKKTEYFAREIKKIARAPETIAEGIQFFYNKRREELINEWRLKKRKSPEKAAEDKIGEEFKGKGIEEKTWKDLLTELTEGVGEKNGERIIKKFEELGILGPGEFAEIIKNPQRKQEFENIKKEYEKAAKEKGLGLVFWLLALLIFIIKAAKTIKETIKNWSKK